MCAARLMLIKNSKYVNDSFVSALGYFKIFLSRIKTLIIFIFIAGLKIYISMAAFPSIQYLQKRFSSDGVNYLKDFEELKLKKKRSTSEIF